MKKLFLAVIVGLALCANPNMSLAGPPGFYAGQTYVSPFPPVFPIGPTTSGYSYYSSPYGYRTYNSYSYTPTPWGWSGYQSSGTYVRPIVNAPFHSVYWDPFAMTYRYGPGYRNTPSYSYGFGW